MDLAATMANMSIEDLRDEPFVFFEFSITSLSPETNNIRIYTKDVASHILFSIAPNFSKAKIEEADIRVVASPAERKYTARLVKTIGVMTAALFDSNGKMVVACDDNAIMVLSIKEVEAATSSGAATDGSFWWAHLVCAAREGTPDAQVIREIEPMLAAKGFRDIHITSRTGQEFGFSIGKMHVKFAPEPTRGLDVRTLYQLKKMKLIAGTSVALNFKSNEALQKHLGLCGDCLCRNCECASSSSSSRGKNARDAREAYAERRKKKLAKA